MNPVDGRVVSNFIVQALEGKDITIFGDGLQTRSFQYVDDLVEGMIRMMNSDPAFLGPVNLGILMNLLCSNWRHYRTYGF
jgi:UDP-glucuronate decarboxylase